MGSPKALLEYRGETFVDRWIGILGPHAAPVIVVVGAEAERIRAGAARRDQALWVTNPDYLRGQLSSLQCGLRAVSAEATGVLFTPVDHPAVRATTVAALAAGAGSRLRIARCGGRRGHPVYIPAALIPEFLAETASARAVVERHAAGIDYLDTDDPGVVADVDNPEAYRRLLAEAAP